jgi:hypothetical protein
MVSLHESKPQGVAVYKTLYLYTKVVMVTLEKERIFIFFLIPL